MILITIAMLVVALVVVTWVYMQQPQFGKVPEGERLARIQKSPNYRDGSFQNRSFTPDLAEGVSYYKVIKDFIFGKSKRAAPATVLPGEKTDLKNLNSDEDIIVWFGHSSYFIQIGGKRILVDPVFSGNASPLSFTTRSFDGADIYTTEDMPEIDFLFISHDHYDHLDYKTIKQLQPKVKLVVTGLGVGAHLEYWGYNAAQIKELDWNEHLDMGNGFEVNTVSARHFSGRGFKRNGTLWTSFVFTTPFGRLFLGGDSGYDTHFVEIGEKFGPFDLVILENGQYNESWKYIHMMPEQVVQAAIDLKARKLFPVHWAKFTLALHDWDEPINRVLKETHRLNMPVMHPRIGQAVNLTDTLTHERWWDDHK